MDKIIIGGLRLTTVIGTLAEERRRKQQLIINLELGLPLQAAGKSDELSDSVDYSRIEAKIIEMGAKTRFFLLERFAEATAELCLAEKPVCRVKVEVIKPGALRYSDTVAICIERTKET
ncbi:MAG: dihydroneopterin aldolase [Victivallaceae bacterium]|nr:dihydroneopterin aldolase [Victivallaceae bacterium]